MKSLVERIDRPIDDTAVETKKKSTKRRYQGYSENIKMIAGGVILRSTSREVVNRLEPL